VSNSVERKILTLLINKSADLQNSGIIDIPEKFFQEPFCRILYKKVINKIVSNENFDLVSLSEEAAFDEKDEIVSISKDTVDPAMVGPYIEILKTNYIYSIVTKDVVKLADSATKENILPVYDQVMRKLEEALGESSEGQAQFLSDIIKTFDQPRQEKAFATKLNGLDLMLNGGPCEKYLMIIAARSGHGKTSFATQITTNFAKAKIPCAIFSMEMENSQVAYRIAGQVSKLPIYKLTNKKFSEAEKVIYESSLGEMSQLPLILDDTCYSFSSVAHKIKMYNARFGTKVFVIDYLQLLINDESKSLQEITYMTRTLKKLAKRLNVLIIALSQFNRNADKREDSKPQLGDLYKSGSLEQDPDLVVFITNYFMISRNEEDRGNVDITVAKHRYGPVGVCKAFLDLDRQTWSC
jgi:replicative DNA helicase